MIHHRPTKEELSSLINKRIMSNIISRRPKEVAFPQYSDWTFIPKDNFESKWYSAQEKQSILQAVARDAIQLSREIRGNASSEDISPEQLCKCVGIDALVNRGLARRMMDHMRAHIEAVLFEQGLDNIKVFVTWRNSARYLRRVRDGIERWHKTSPCALVSFSMSSEIQLDICSLLTNVEVWSHSLVQSS